MGNDFTNMVHLWENLSSEKRVVTERKNSIGNPTNKAGIVLVEKRQNQRMQAVSVFNERLWDVYLRTGTYALVLDNLRKY